jgi:hypothetical protein
MVSLNTLLLCGTSHCCADKQVWAETCCIKTIYYTKDLVVFQVIIQIVYAYILLLGRQNLNILEMYIHIRYVSLALPLIVSCCIKKTED